MPRAETHEAQAQFLRDFFTQSLRHKFLRYQSAELHRDDGSWEPWNDLPIRLFIGSEEEPIAVAWSHFSRLWIESGTTLPFSTEGSEVRWVENSLPELNQHLGSRLCSVHLGRGEMSVEGRDIEIWTRLLLVFETGCLEIYNALDENGYAVHSQKPSGQLIQCA